MTGCSKTISRRELLKTAGRKTVTAALAIAGLDALRPTAAHAAPKEELDDLDRYDFLIPRVKFPCDPVAEDKWNTHPVGDVHLLEEFSSVVRCKVKLLPHVLSTPPRLGQESDFNAVVDFNDIERLRRYPFLFMTAEGKFGFTERQKANLKQYVQEGGFLLMDDCVWKSVGDFFYVACCPLLEEVFGQGSLKRIPNDHEVFRNVFDLTNIGLPYLQGKNYGARGVFVGDRLAVFLSSTDVHCGWVDRSGRWFGRSARAGRNRVGGRHTYREAIQMGINIIMYALSH